MKQKACESIDQCKDSIRSHRTWYLLSDTEQFYKNNVFIDIVQDKPDDNLTLQANPQRNDRFYGAEIGTHFIVLCDECSYIPQVYLLKQKIIDMFYSRYIIKSKHFFFLICSKLFIILIRVMLTLKKIKKKILSYLCRSTLFSRSFECPNVTDHRLDWATRLRLQNEDKKSKLH